MQLETHDFTLRPLEVDDATERYLSWLRDDEVSRTLDTDGSKQTLDTLRDYILSHNNTTRFLFGIFTKDGLHIGTHSFRAVPEHKRASIGVMIGDKSYWGQGVPLQTRACLIDWAFDNQGLEKLEAGCVSINIPAVYNFKRQRWAHEGTRKAHGIIEGRPVDLLLFGLLKVNWCV
jgi:ribosomal-protein-alanine N-acetyltransferase